MYLNSDEDQGCNLKTKTASPHEQPRNTRPRYLNEITFIYFSSITKHSTNTKLIY